jgi:alpha/beta hydrolase family protein
MGPERQGPAGRTKLFDAATLKSLYPTHDAFVKTFAAAAEALEKQGYLLKPEADAARKAAQGSQIGR